MPFGLPWSEQFIEQLADVDERREFVRDQVRTRLALMIRALREQEDRGWSQRELGQRLGKPQSVVSRIEDPDYGKVSLQTMFEVAEAFGLPLWIDMPEWEEWLRRTKEVEASKLWRRSFDAQRLMAQARSAQSDGANGKIAQLSSYGPNQAMLPTASALMSEFSGNRPAAQQTLTAAGNENVGQSASRAPIASAVALSAV